MLLKDPEYSVIKNGTVLPREGGALREYLGLLKRWKILLRGNEL